MGLAGLEKGLGFLKGESGFLDRSDITAEHPLERGQEFLVGRILAHIGSILETFEHIGFLVSVGRIVDVGNETRKGIFINGILDAFAGRLEHRSHLHDRLGCSLGKVADLGGKVGAVLGRHCSENVSHNGLDGPLPGILGID